MPYREIRQPADCAIVCSSPVEGELIRSIIERQFEAVHVLSVEEALLHWSHDGKLAVVVLACQDISVSEQLVRDRLLGGAGRPGPQLVLMCARESVVQAYELCRELSIADYVVFWPVSLDPRRLQMAVFRACDAYLAASALWQSSAAPPETGPGPETMQRRQILVVDDNEFLQQIVVTVLNEAGYEAHGASGGRTAREMLRELRPLAILLDVDMPEIGGLQLLRELKAEAATADTPVIMLSGMNQRDVVMEACREGAVDFIVKPFKRDLLLQKLQAAVQRRGGGATDPAAAITPSKPM